MACGDAPLLSRAQSPHQYYRATRPAESRSPGAGASLAHAAYSSGRMSIAVGPLKGPCDGRGTNKPRHLDSPLSPNACTSREIPARDLPGWRRAEGLCQRPEELPPPYWLVVGHVVRFAGAPPLEGGDGGCRGVLDIDQGGDTSPAGGNWQAAPP